MSGCKLIFFTQFEEKVGMIFMEEINDEDDADVVVEEKREVLISKKRYVNEI